jgi:hypothetical protein
VSLCHLPARPLMCSLFGLNPRRRTTNPQRGMFRKAMKREAFDGSSSGPILTVVPQPTSPPTPLMRIGGHG